MKYWQKLTIKLKEADFMDDYIAIIIQLFGNRPIEEYMDSPPEVVADVLTQYAISSGIYFVAMPDDIRDTQQSTKISEKEYKCGQV